MMTIRRTTLVLFAFTLAAVLLSLWAYPRMPEIVPTHWGADGQPNGWSGRGTTAILLPAMILGIGLLLLYIPMIDPLRANVDKFRGGYNWMVVGFAGFMFYMHVLTTVAALGVALNMTFWLIPAMAVLFFGLGFLVESAKPNWFIGIRTPWTLSNPVVWEKTHKLGGWLFKGSAVLMLVGLAFPPQIGFVIIMVPLMVTGFGTILYSYLVYREEQRKSN
jgi:uncharacterized membrane protein